MKQKTVIRWFHDTVNNKFISETIKWGYAPNDPRSAPIGDSSLGVDEWIVLSIANPGFDLSSIEHTYQQEPYIYTNEDMTMEVRNKSTKVISFTKMDVYNTPLNPGYVEITMAEYNDAIQALIDANNGGDPP